MASIYCCYCRLIDKRNSCRNSLLIINIFLTKHVNEVSLLIRDPVLKELPSHKRKRHCRDRVGQEHLHEDGPPEPPKVGRVPRERVDTLGDKNVVVSRALFDLMGKVRSRCVHRERAEKLPDNNHGKRGDHDKEVVFHPREEEPLDKVLDYAEGPGTDPLCAVVDEERVPRHLVGVEEVDEAPLPHVVEGEATQEQPKVQTHSRGQDGEHEADPKDESEGPPDVHNGFWVLAPKERNPSQRLRVHFNLVVVVVVCTCFSIIYFFIYENIKVFYFVS